MVGWHNLRPVTWGISLLEVAGGLLLLVGYLTPVAGLLMGVLCVAGALSWFQPPHPNFLDTAVTIALATANAVAIAWLGPGAFSIDAHLFGRREIVIPDASSLSDS